MHLLLKVENGCFVQLWLCSWEYRSVEAEREPDHVFIMITLLSELTSNLGGSLSSALQHFDW